MLKTIVIILKDTQTNKKIKAGNRQSAAVKKYRIDKTRLRAPSNVSFQKVPRDLWGKLLGII
jgi:hypothetical protein